MNILVCVCVKKPTVVGEQDPHHCGQSHPPTYGLTEYLYNIFKCGFKTHHLLLSLYGFIVRSVQIQNCSRSWSSEKLVSLRVSIGWVFMQGMWTRLGRLRRHRPLISFSSGMTTSHRRMKRRVYA